MPERSFDSFAIVEVAVDGLLEMVVVKSFKGPCAMLCKLNRQKCAGFRAIILGPWRKKMSWHQIASGTTKVARSDDGCWRMGQKVISTRVS